MFFWEISTCGVRNFPFRLQKIPFLVLAVPHMHACRCWHYNLFKDNFLGKISWKKSRCIYILWRYFRRCRKSSQDQRMSFWQAELPPFPYHKLEFHFVFQILSWIKYRYVFPCFLTTFLVKIKRKCLIQPELKYFKMRIHPPPKKKFNHAGTAPAGSAIPGSATERDISSTFYSKL